MIASLVLKWGFLFRIMLYICSSQKHKTNFMSKTIAQLIKELQTVKQYAEKVDAQNEILRESNATLHAEIETLKKDRDNFERNFNNVNECYEGIFDSYEKLKADYALLEERSYTQSDNYTQLNKMHNDLIESHNKVTAENHALKAEIERTNRHINLAENQLHREQQPLVVNHYHNCVINK